MSRQRILATLLLTGLCLTACTRHDHGAALTQRLAEHPARTLAAWTGWPQKALKDRIGPAPDFLVDYIALDNQLNGYSQTPKPAIDSQAFAAEVAQAVDEFPPAVKKQLNDHALGIFLVTELGTSAYTELLKDAAPRTLGFIVLDFQALDKTANAWASWRENTPFKSSPALETRVIIEPEAQDLRKNAISYVVLHELGHLVGVARGAHASWWDKARPADHPFSAISWTSRQDTVISRWDEAFSDRRRVRFYAAAKEQLPADLRPETYAALAKTDFVSLYAATGIHDDFAETYAMYVHVVLQGRPWQLTLRRDDHAIFTMNAPILQERCAKKRVFLSTLVGSPATMPASGEEAVRVAAVQCYSEMGHTPENTANLAALIRQAAAAGAKFVVTPECALQGYMDPPSWTSWTTEAGQPWSVANVAEPVPGPATATFANLAKELKLYICLGLIESAGNTFFNAQVLLAPDGSLVAHHRKKALWPPGDGAWCSEGDLPVQVVDTPYGRVGLMICYDFHELPELLGKAKADLVLYSVGWYGPNEKDWFSKRFPREAVMPYGFSVVAANWAGQTPADEWPGRGFSCILAGDGTVCAMATSVIGNELVVADVPRHRRPAAAALKAAAQRPEGPTAAPATAAGSASP